MTATSLISRARRVAFQGEAGAYANLAAREALPHVMAVPKPTFEDAVDAVRSGDSDLCIIPVENSLHGRIADIYHLVQHFGRMVKGHFEPGRADLFILGEYFLPIHHQLLGVRNSKLEDVQTVLSQDPALDQCRRVIRDLKLNAKSWYDTAGAARHVAELNDPTVAAIASSFAGTTYGLKVLKENVEDEAYNTTRFLIVGGEPDDAPNDGAPIITTIVFRVRNVPAALYKALGGFATNSVNMIKLESYQLGGSFNATQFYADIEGHPDQSNVRMALEELHYFSTKLTVLGVYPADKKGRGIHT
jgi:prephenate dehydratase